MHPKKTIIFDFDGTLVDIEPVFLKIFNTLAPEFGYASIPSDAIPQLKKLHLRTLIWKFLGFRVFLLPKILRRGREEYHRLIPEVELFPGIQELLSTLRAQGISIGILSSSRKDTIIALLEKFHLSMDFVYQCDLFNKAKVLNTLLNEKSLIPQETLYVGDEVRDVEACHKVGLDVLAVTWGLNSKEALQKTGAQTIDRPGELLAKLSLIKEETHS